MCKFVFHHNILDKCQGMVSARCQKRSRCCPSVLYNSKVHNSVLFTDNRSITQMDCSIVSQSCSMGFKSSDRANSGLWTVMNSPITITSPQAYVLACWNSSLTPGWAVGMNGTRRSVKIAMYPEPVKDIHKHVNYPKSTSCSLGSSSLTGQLDCFVGFLSYAHPPINTRQSVPIWAVKLGWVNNFWCPYNITYGDPVLNIIVCLSNVAWQLDVIMYCCVAQPMPPLLTEQLFHKFGICGTLWTQCVCVWHIRKPQCLLCNSWDLCCQLLQRRYQYVCPLSVSLKLVFPLWHGKQHQKIVLSREVCSVSQTSESPKENEENIAALLETPEIASTSVAWVTP